VDLSLEVTDVRRNDEDEPGSPRQARRQFVSADLARVEDHAEGTPLDGVVDPSCFAYGEGLRLDTDLDRSSFANGEGSRFNSDVDPSSFAKASPPGPRSSSFLT
jgi:hypothetical protein